jgi:hypothetical protein
MRKLPLLLALLLFATLGTAASAQASPLPLANQVVTFVAPAEEDEGEEGEEAEDESEGDAELDRELCEYDPELFCEEEAEEQASKRRGDDGCLLKNASAALTANPGRRRLRLTVHYRTLKPASVTVEASLRGPKGTVRLGTSHARFRRSGVYRDTFGLAERQMKKALAAHKFFVELRVVNSPPSCGVEIKGASRRARH